MTTPVIQHFLTVSNVSYRTLHRETTFSRQNMALGSHKQRKQKDCVVMRVCGSVYIVIHFHDEKYNSFG